MPSAKDPASTVFPGPGRLPASTVPANALIGGGGGGSDAALQAHITDPVDAHLATAIGAAAGPNWADGNTNPAAPVQARLDEIITDLVSTEGAKRTGQPGYASGVTELTIPSGTLDVGIQRALDLQAVKADWVLDAAAAAGDADFVGANALINAMVAVAGAKNPRLYLRAGTYNWADASDFANVTVVGSNRGTVIIQNGAGDLRSGVNARFEDVTIDLSGDLLTSSQAVFRTITLDVAGDVRIPGGSNAVVFEHVLSVSPNNVIVGGSRAQFKDWENCQFEDSGERTEIQQGVVTSVRDLTLPIIDSGGTGCSYSTLLVTGLTSFDAFAFFFSGDDCQGRGLTVENNITPTANFQVVTITGSRNHVSNVRGNNNGDHLGVGINLSGSHNVLDTVSLENVGAASSELVRIDVSSFNNTLRNLDINGVSGGVPGQIIDHRGERCILENVRLRNISVAAGTEMLQLTSAGGVIRNLTIDGSADAVVGGTTIDIASVRGRLSLENIRAVEAAGTSGQRALNFQTGASDVFISNSYFKTTEGDGAGDGAVVFFNNDNIGISNTIFEATKGRACSAIQVGVKFDTCTFTGGDGSIDAGIQLFSGYGNQVTGDPLVMDDCTMIYGRSNVAPTTGTGAGEPVIFFGGTAGAAVVGHGRMVVDGLIIKPASTLVHQHRDSLLVIDTEDQVQSQGSTFKNIFIDLDEKPFETDGAGRQTLAVSLSGAASVVELNGDAAKQSLRVENLRIINVTETDVAGADFRQHVAADGAVLDGLTLDGPSSATHDIAGGWSEPLIDVVDSIVENYQIWPSNPVRVSGASALLLVRKDCVLTNGRINQILGGSPPTAVDTVLRFTASDSVVDKLDVNFDAGLIATTAVVFDAGDRSKLVNSNLDFAAGTLFGNQIMDIQNAANTSIVDGNTITTADVGGSTFLRLLGVERCAVTNNVWRSTNGDAVYGVELDATSLNNLIKGNHFEDRSLDDNNMLDIAVGAERNRIEGNAFVNAKSGTSEGGLHITLGGDGTIFTDNLLECAGESGSPCRVELLAQNINCSDNHLLTLEDGDCQIFVNDSNGDRCNITNNILDPRETSGARDSEIRAIDGADNLIIVGNSLRRAGTGIPKIDLQGNDDSIVMGNDLEVGTITLGVFAVSTSNNNIVMGNNVNSGGSVTEINGSGNILDTTDAVGVLRSGSSASVATVGDSMIVSGLSGVTNDDVNLVIDLAGFANGGNNGRFTITSLNGASTTEVVCLNSGAVTEGAEVAQTWQIRSVRYNRT